MRSDPRIRIYPEYFDKKLTRSQGRKVSSKKAIEEPNLLELKIAAQKLGFDVDTRPDSSYSKQWQEPKGLLLLDVGENDIKPKTAVLKELATTVTSYARPKIIEFKRQQEKQAKEKKQKPKPSKIDHDRSKSSKKPLRRRR